MFLDFLLYPIDQFVYVPVLHSFTHRYHIRSSSLIDEDTKFLFPNQAEAEPGMETGFLDLQHSSCPFFVVLLSSVSSTVFGESEKSICKEETALPIKE